jgi:hypothetical protein
MQEIINCGFVSWIDPDWTLPLQNALGRLWAMHDEINRDRNQQGLEHYRKLQEVDAEKKKLEKEYKTLVDDVNRMMDRAEKRAVEVNLAKMKEEEEKAELLQIKCVHCVAAVNKIFRIYSVNPAASNGMVAGNSS